jgi:methylenetetrahydrofolate reductase (NADPH)
MHINDILEAGKPSFSFEFFPPKTDLGWDDLYQTIDELSVQGPSFVSVTYGAGGTTRDMTHNLVVRIKNESDIPPIPHLTCIGHSKEEIELILTRYAEAGVNNILALRGDPPRNQPNYDRSKDDFRHAIDLVQFIKEFNASGRHPDPRGFGIGVAGFPEGHPLTPNRLLEMDYMKQKVDAGADYICTQLFFDNHDFYDYRERCQQAGIQLPIITGIMPVTTLTGMHRMAELAEGSRFPAKLMRALNRANNHKDAIERVGIHYASQQCAELLNNEVDGIHFYTLNKSKATREIYANLGLLRS